MKSQIKNQKVKAKDKTKEQNLNNNHFKEMTSLNKLTNSLTNFFFLYKFNVGLFLLHKLSPTATSLTGTVPVLPLSEHHYSPSGSAILTHVSFPK